jgi:molecular chaperone DnaK (HSP70)
MNKRHRFGLDFGTSTTLLTVQQDQEAEVSAVEFMGLDGEVSEYLPSRVGLHDGKIVAGFLAAKLRSDSQLKTISPKAFLYSVGDIAEGDSADDLGAREIADFPSLTLFDAIKAVFQEVVQLGGKSKVKPDFASDEFVLGCPSNWSQAQRALVMGAAKSAGIVNVKLVNSLEEPVAAGWSLRHDSDSGVLNDGKVLIVDSGGGTTDVALIDVKGGTYNLLASDSSPQAGEKADELIRQMLLNKFRKADKNFLSEALNDKVRTWLLDTAEALKIRATGSSDEIKFSYPDWVNPFISAEIRNAIVSIPASEVLAACEPVVKAIVDLVDDVLFRGTLTAANSEDLEKVLKDLPGRESQLTYGSERGDWELDDRRPESAAVQTMRRDWTLLQENLRQSINLVVLAGGMSRVPRLLKSVEKAIPKATVATEKIGLTTTFDAQKLVAQGLAMLTPPTTLNVYRLPLSLHLEWSEVIPGSSQVGNRSVCLMQAFDSCAPDEVFSDFGQVSHFGQYAELQISKGVKVVTDGTRPRLVAYAPEVGKDLKINLKPVVLGVTSSEPDTNPARGSNKRSTVEAIAVELNSAQPLRFKRYASGAIGLRDSDGNLFLCVPRSEHGQGTLEIQVILGDSSRWMSEAKTN